MSVGTVQFACDVELEDEALVTVEFKPLLPKADAVKTEELEMPMDSA